METDNNGYMEGDIFLEYFDKPTILLDTSYQILSENQAYRDIYHEKGNLRGRKCHEVSHSSSIPCDQIGEDCPLKAVLETGQSQRILHTHHDNERVDIEMVPLRSTDGEIIYFLEHVHQLEDTRSYSPRTTLIGQSKPFLRMMERIHRVAASMTTALLLGESGTGKELAARAIHDQSNRAHAPFIPVDCSGVTETLFESELFGHRKGSFTGASSNKKGLVDAAHGGTLFLDEIGDVPLSQQVKLLRLLEAGTYRAVGSTEIQHANFRLVCATNKNLKLLVEQGAFREDLYYRISAFQIDLPPLRDRHDDILLIAREILTRISPEKTWRLSDATSSCILNYAFPGNIRELRNTLEHAILLADDNTIEPWHLPEYCNCGIQHPGFSKEKDTIKIHDALNEHILKMVAAHQGDRKSLADQLGISERTLYRKLRGLRKQID